VTQEYEKRRQGLQKKLDSIKTPSERNRLGQFATPYGLAMDMLEYASVLFPKNNNISFLDPAFGTGAFYSALTTVFPGDQIDKTTGFEIDPHYRNAAVALWSHTTLELLATDFTQAASPTRQDEKYNLIICNPPYVRHHHIPSEEKTRMQALIDPLLGESISGLAGLYCYFLVLSHLWMKEEGIAGWLIPSEFMDVNYGRALKRYLLSEVALLRIHRFDPVEVQFKDALVSSAVVWFRRTKPSKDHTVEFTFGGTIKTPKMTKTVSTTILSKEPKWTRFPVASRKRAHDESTLGNFFSVTRGLATGDNSFFILSKNQIHAFRLPMEVFRPMLPSPRFLKVDEICADDEGNPILEPQLFLLDCRIPPEVIKIRHPSLWEYLESGRQKGVSERYLCKHRTPWYVQEDRPPSPFICTYMGRGASGRGSPFRFVLNHSKATVANAYLILYPKSAIATALEHDPTLARSIWTTLNNIDPDAIRLEGRVYGGGLHKIEPKELSNVPADAIKALVDGCLPQAGNQLELFDLSRAGVRS
jgi:adenine-specific DNA-methyltransferase